MNNEQTQVQPSSVGVDDIVYLFFRHKWKITFCTLVGCGIAAWIYLGNRTEYRVQAKVLVRYITEKKNPLASGPGDKDTVRSLDPRDGANMLAEVEILRSA